MSRVNYLCFAHLGKQVQTYEEITTLLNDLSGM